MSITAFSTAILLASAPADAVMTPPSAAVSTTSAPAETAAPPVSADEPQPAPTADAATVATTPPPVADQPDQAAIIVTAKPRADPGDPVEAVNEITFSAVQAVDTAFVGPLAMAYKRNIPNPVRSGLRHFLDNLQEPIVFLNYMLQLKPGKAAETLGRFTINSTIGAAGLIDVAKSKPFHLPRHPNGFAFTLGYYGVKPGPFLFLPLIGPTTVRDLFGRWVDLLILPVAVGKPFTDPAYGATTLVFRSLDERAESDDRLRRLKDGSQDHYKALRDDYLRNRQSEIDLLHAKKDRPAPQVPAEPAASGPAGASSANPDNAASPPKEQ
jgi:phospholipid-binding lipoprotein MlaA